MSTRQWIRHGQAKYPSLRVQYLGSADHNIKDVSSIVTRYAAALIKFHKEFPARDRIPEDQMGKCHAADAV